MKQWNDVYFRSNQRDNGQLPSNGCQSSCFDIITRTEPLDNPSVLINSDWNKNDSQSMDARMNNYIYVRGKNLAGKDQQGHVYLYYSPANLLLYPSIWINNSIKVGAEKECFDFSVKKDGRFVCADDKQGCFCWAPEMITNDHYCLISRAVTQDHPADIPALNGITDLGKFVSENRNYGWRNVTVIDRNSADFSQSVDYSQGDEEGIMHIILSCTGAPVGAEVAFDCPAPGASPAIHMPRTKITSPNQDLGIVCHIPKDFNGRITYYYWANGKTPGNPFKLEMNCVYFTQADHPLYAYAKHYEELGFSFPKTLRENLRLGGSIGPTRGIILGQYSTQMRQQ